MPFVQEPLWQPAGSQKLPKSYNRYLVYDIKTMEGCNRGHGLSAAIKLGTPEPKFLQSGRKLPAASKAKPLFGA